MCIRYHIEFWLPVSKDKPDWERRVKRGLVQPGTNMDVRKIPFYECRGRFLLHATCPRSEIRDGGCWRGRILDLCYQDNDCFLRLAELQAACTAAKREAEVMDVVREAPSIQNGYTQRWRKAYDDWMMAYENHRDCLDRRYKSQLFQDLKRAGDFSSAATGFVQRRWLNLSMPLRKPIMPCVRSTRVRSKKEWSAKA